MFFFASMEVSLALRQSIEAFILLGGDVKEEFDQTSKWVIYMRMVDYVAQTCIGDGILVRSGVFMLRTISLQQVLGRFIVAGSYMAGTGSLSSFPSFCGLPARVGRLLHVIKSD